MYHWFDRVFSLPIVDVNLRPMDFVEKEAIMDKVDLTEDMDVDSSSNLSNSCVGESVTVNYRVKIDNNTTDSQEIENDMTRQKLCDIDMNDCDQVRMDGVELEQNKDQFNIHEKMEVDTDMRSLDDVCECSVQKGPFYCTSCHRAVLVRSNVKIFKKDNYNFEIEVVKNVLDDQYRQKSDDGKEYICQNCSKNLQKKIQKFLERVHTTLK